MNQLHDVLHSMPAWVVIVLIVLLLMASAAGETNNNVVDTIGSWIAFGVLIAGVLAWFWT
jgi:hypothetical protein